MRSIVFAIALVACVVAGGGGRVLASVLPSAVVANAVGTPPPPLHGSFDDLADPRWHAAVEATAFGNVTTKQTATEETTAYVVFGTEALYCAFSSTQQRSPIVATQKTNDVGFGLDDYVTLMFDTSGNGTNDYFFSASPRGVRYQTASESSRYDPPWTVRSAIEPGRYLVEMEIPYKILRAASGGWRLNLARFIQARQETYTWSYAADMVGAYDVTEWPALATRIPIAARRPPPTAQVYGLETAGGDRRQFAGLDGTFRTSAVRVAGIDAKLPLTSSLNLDATFNPDFSALESDQQIISPQEFPYQYAEYRPFFTQGATYLPGSSIFSSPSIGVFSRGEKLEGQAGDINVGLLNVGTAGASDEAYDVAFNAPNRELNVTFSGASVARPHGNDAVRQLAFGVTNLRSKIAFGAASAVESGTSITNQAAATASSGFVSVTKPNYSASTYYFDTGPQYAPYDAYVPVVDVRGFQANASLTSATEPDRPIRFEQISAYADRYVDRSGRAHEEDTGATADVTFHDLLDLQLIRSQSTLRTYDEGFPLYTGGRTLPYDTEEMYVDYRASKPDNVDAYYLFGPYGAFYFQQVGASGRAAVSRTFSFAVDFGRVVERMPSSRDGQGLLRLTLFGQLTPGATFGAAYRDIAGTGGFSAPGKNVSLTFAQRYRNGSTLRVEFGSPAATRTLDRFVVKYVQFVGSGSGE